MEFYAATLYITVFSLFILILLILKNKTLTRSTARSILLTAVLIIAGASLEFLGVALNGADASLRILHSAVKFLELSLTPFIPVVFAHAFSEGKTWNLLFIPPVLHIVFEAVSGFFGGVFFVDDKNIYHHGKLYFIYYLIILFGAVHLVVSVIRRDERYQGQNRLAMTMILIFAVGGIAVQTVSGNIRITWLTVAVGMILFYIYYGNLMLQVDPMTELLNRRAYDRRIPTMRSRAVVQIFDVNDFKGVNDRNGHNFGDYCLKTVASVIRAVYGKVGLCYRIGGDEFCVIIDRRTEAVDPKALSVEFSKKIEERRNSEPNLPSVAVGYALFDPEKDDFVDAVMVADEQMYSNKENCKR